MSESFVLPVANMIQPLVLAEPVVEGEEDPTSDFTIEEVAIDELPTDPIPADMIATDQPPQDRLQMLIEDLSGITGAFHQAPAKDGQEGGEAVLPESKVVPPELGPRIALAPALDLPPTLPVQATPDLPQIDLVPADPSPLPVHPSRDAASAPPDRPLTRIPVGSVGRQMAEAVVTAREDRIEVALAPEELGRIRMVMTGPEHSPHVMVWAERPEVLDQLRRNASILQDCFGDAGMADASFECQGDGGTGSGGQQPFPDAARQGFDVTESVPVPVAWTPMAIPARLDIRI
jgi:hypothetical protein